MSIPATGEKQPGTQRLEAFSDGVFAIAITLLILEIKVPGAEDLRRQSLSHYLLQQWPKYFAYVFSFVNIGIYWANHHYLFNFFKKTDHILNILNILFLMSISFLPYPTGILGDYIMDPQQRGTAIALFSGAIYIPAIFWNMFWIYGSQKGKLVDSRLSPAFIKKLTRQYLLSNASYLLVFIISLFLPVTAMILGIGITFLYLLPPRKPEYNN
jgi:uncharacterized membrane protein